MSDIDKGSDSDNVWNMHFLIKKSIFVLENLLHHSSDNSLMVGKSKSLPKLIKDVQGESP